MDKLAIIVSVISVLGTISSIFFSYQKSKMKNLDDYKNEGINEGIVQSDLGYIKACVDRVEKNLSKVDDKYQGVIERLSKVEEALKFIRKGEK